MDPGVRGPFLDPGVDPAWFGGEHALGGIDELPTNFEAYGLLLHGFEVQDGSASTRRRWRELAKRFGLAYDPSIVVSMSRHFRKDPGSWPQEHIGGEGSLDRVELQALVGHLAPLTGEQECSFYYCFMFFIGPEPLAGRCFVGPLAAVTGFLVDERIRRHSPTFWWPVDRSWIVMSGYDSDFTIIGGPRAPIDALVAEPELEVLRMDPTAVRRGEFA